MQASKFRPVVRLVSFNKALRRTIVVASNNDNNFDNLKSWKEIPGPKESFLSLLKHFLPGGGGNYTNVDSPFASRNQLAYGPIVKTGDVIGMSPTIILGDPEAVATVLRNENWSPVRPTHISLEYYRKKYKGEKYDGRATGLLTEQGDVWKEFRSAVNPVLLQPKNIKLYSTIIDEVASDMIKRMRAKRDENYMFRDILDSEINLWALESTATVALGCRLRCLDSDLPEDSPEKKLIKCNHDIVITTNELDGGPVLWKYISTPLYRKVMKLLEQHETLTKYFIKKALDESKLNANQKSDQEKSVLEKLREINEDYAYIMASDMLSGGVDTVSNGMIFILYLLAKNQDKQDILREEVLSKSSKTPYLEACVKEAMRVMPPTSGNLRTTTRDYNLMGYNIPKGMTVVFLHHQMSIMEQHFPRAQEFLPERWLVDKNHPLYYGNTHPFVYSPFGFGVRTCIGRRFAKVVIDTFLRHVIENFKLEWVGPALKFDQKAVNFVKGPFNLIFKDVK